MRDSALRRAPEPAASPVRATVSRRPVTCHILRSWGIRREAGVALHETSYPGDGSLPAPAGRGYSYAEDVLVDVTDRTPPGVYGAAGAMVSSTTDPAAYASALGRVPRPPIRRPATDNREGPSRGSVLDIADRLVQPFIGAFADFRIDRSGFECRGGVRAYPRVHHARCSD